MAIPNSLEVNKLTTFKQWSHLANWHLFHSSTGMIDPMLRFPGSTMCDFRTASLKEYKYILSINSNQIIAAA